MDTANLPDSVDWREHKVLTPVKDQGQCGSCWAFSATGALESAYAISTGKLLSISEQQLVDCDNRSDGCDGGTQESAFHYYTRYHAEPETAYAYKAMTEPCNFDASKATKVSDISHTKVPPRNVD